MIVSEAEAVFMYYKQFRTVGFLGSAVPFGLQPGINYLVLDAGGNIKTYKELYSPLWILTLFPCNRFCDNKMSVISSYFCFIVYLIPFGGSLMI